MNRCDSALSHSLAPTTFSSTRPRASTSTVSGICEAPSMYSSSSMGVVEPSPYVPRAGQAAPILKWKCMDDFKDVLARGDPARDG